MPDIRCPRMVTDPAAPAAAPTQCIWQTGDVTDAMGVLLMGDHLTGTHPIAPAATIKPKQVSRPEVARECSSEDWEYFLKRWTSYKTATRIAGDELRIQLLECCSIKLRRDLHCQHNNINTRTEDDILASMRLLAVKRENVMVERLNLQLLQQDSDEGVRNFAARVRGQADVCLFTVTAPNDVQAGEEISYRDHMVKDTIIRGLEDLENRVAVQGGQSYCG